MVPKALTCVGGRGTSVVVAWLVGLFVYDHTNKHPMTNIEDTKVQTPIMDQLVFMTLLRDGVSIQENIDCRRDAFLDLGFVWNYLGHDHGDKVHADQQAK